MQLRPRFIMRLASSFGLALFTSGLFYYSADKMIEFIFRILGV